MSANWIMPCLAYASTLAAMLGLACWRIALDGRPSVSGGQAYRSTYPIDRALLVLLTINAMAIPILGAMTSQDWLSGSPASALSTAGRAVQLVLFHGALGANLVFCHRALSNIDLFSGKRIRNANAAFLAVLPGTSLIFMPLVWFDAHYYSRRFLLGSGVSRMASAALAVAAFALLLTAVLLELMAFLRQEAGVDTTGGTSSSIITFCAAAAGALLLARLVTEIRQAQEAVAAHWLRNRPAPFLASTRRGHLEAVCLLGAGVLIGFGIVTAIVPDTYFGGAPSTGPQAREPDGSAPASNAGQRLQEVADRMNKAGRKQLDPVTWLERAKVEHGTFVFEYSVAVNRLSNPELLSFLQKVQPSIISGYCTDPALQVFRDLGTTLVVRYMYPDRAPLGQVNASVGDCRRSIAR